MDTAQEASSFPTGFYEIVKDAGEIEALTVGRGALQLRPAQVLDKLAVLHDRMAHPAGGLSSYVRGFANTLVTNGHLGRMYDTEFSAGDYIMFYPFTPSMGEEQARQWCTEVAKDMSASVVYQVTSDMMQAAREICYQTAHGVEYIDEPVLPSPCGFAWFDSPLVFRDGRGDLVSMRAVSWSVIPIRFVPHDVSTDRPIRSRVVEGMGARILLWTMHGDPGSAEASEDSVRRFGGLQFNHIMVIPFGERFPASARKAVDESGEETQSALHYVHVIWQLMTSEVASARRHLPDKLTAKRVRRSIMQGEVSVITLRRAHAAGEDSDVGHRAIDWSCRWLVQGHWRHLDSYSGDRHHAMPDRSVRGEIVHCYHCASRITWIPAHIKGPDDRPLKSSERLYRLSR